MADRRDEVNDPIRPTCPRCGWIYYPANLNGALVVAELDDLVAVIFPPGAGGAALPGGIAEYGETPEECAIRETMEETGLAITDLAETCRFLHHGPFGPMLHFGFRARIVGGRPQDGDEGPARLVPVAQATISEKREGSQRIFQAYLQA